MGKLARAFRMIILSGKALLLRARVHVCECVLVKKRVPTRSPGSVSLECFFVQTGFGVVSPQRRLGPSGAVTEMSSFELPPAHLVRLVVQILGNNEMKCTIAPCKFHLELK